MPTIALDDIAIDTLQVIHDRIMFLAKEWVTSSSKYADNYYWMVFGAVFVWKKVAEELGVPGSYASVAYKEYRALLGDYPATGT